jgi:Fe-only nitrogenase, delta subunit
MEDLMNGRIEQLVDYIMKWCLWQFNSRVWDREKQNEGILTRAMQLLCNEPVTRETPADKYYWVEAAVLTRDFKNEFSWINIMSAEEIKALMKGLRERIDYLTITGSLNQELTNPQY